jgi:hypothetical protein
MSHGLPCRRISVLETRYGVLDPLDDRLKEVSDFLIVDSPLVRRQSLPSVVSPTCAHLLSLVRRSDELHPRGVLADVDKTLKADV